MSPNSALPPHLQGTTAEGTGRDHDNIVQKQWKLADKAFGPRCPKVAWYKLAAWSVIRFQIPFTGIGVPIIPALKRWREFPVVIAAYNCPRWMGAEDKSILFVPQFMSRWIWPWTKKGPITVTEMKADNPFYQRGHVTTLPGLYGPSPIQGFAYGWSWQLTWPGFHGVLSFRADAREDGPGVPAHTSKSRAFWRKMNGIFRKKYLSDPRKRDEFVFFARGLFGRWTSGDMYYVAPAVTVQFDYN